MTLSHIPKITYLTSKIIRVLGCNPGPMTLQGTNTYIIGNGSKRILLDTGSPNVPEYIENLKNTIRKEKIELAHIIITHWHEDHIGGLKDILNNIELPDCMVWKFPRSDELNNDIQENYKISWLKDKQQFEIEGATLKIIHTPGHTTDHIITFLEEDKAIFSGDCVLGEGTAVFENLYEYMKSLNLILNMRPAIIYPAHGKVIDNPVEKLTYYIEHRNQREQQILECIRKTPNKIFTPIDIVKEVYTTTPENLWRAAGWNVLNHLEKLRRENKVEYINEGYKAKF